MVAFSVPPSNPPFNDEVLTRVSGALVRVMSGGMNIVGEVTLDAGVTQTVVEDERVGPDTCIVLMAKTANAAAESPYISTTDNSFIINHANSAQTDRDFRYATLG